MQISVRPTQFMLGLGKSKTVFITCKNYAEKEQEIAIGIDENPIMKDKSKRLPLRMIFAKVSSMSCIKIPVKFATKSDTKSGVYRIPIYVWESATSPKEVVNEENVVDRLGKPHVFNLDITVRKRGEGSTPKTLLILGSLALAGYSYLIFKKIKGEKVKIIPPWKGY